MHTRPLGEMGTNCYVLYDKGREDALAIDPGAEPEAVRALLGGRRLSAILLTHGHGDHIGAVSALRGPETRVYIHREDGPMLTDAALSLVEEFGMQSPGPADGYLQAGEMTLAGLPFTVLHTPGHTPGGVCLRFENALFTGDTLFRRGVGRTDFPGGSARALRESLRMLLSLDPGHAVYPGHGGATTLGEERRFFA